MERRPHGQPAVVLGRRTRRGEAGPDCHPHNPAGRLPTRIANELPARFPPAGRSAGFRERSLGGTPPAGDDQRTRGSGLRAPMGGQPGAV